MIFINPNIRQKGTKVSMIYYSIETQSFIKNKMILNRKCKSKVLIKIYKVLTLCILDNINRSENIFLKNGQKIKYKKNGDIFFSVTNIFR